ncbi:MAG: hypothetical protein CMF66_06705, partial [Magnetovibrio sp.]|nr:hypothetical protein [Magnetovibrio sp.]
DTAGQHCFNDNLSAVQHDRALLIETVIRSRLQSPIGWLLHYGAAQVRQGGPISICFRAGVRWFGL